MSAARKISSTTSTTSTAPARTGKRAALPTLPTLPTPATMPVSDRPARVGGATGKRPPLLYARSCALTALLPPALRQMLKDEIAAQLERQFQAPQWNYPIWLFRDSEILWGERARMLHAGRALRGLPLKGPPGKDYGLLWLLLYDVERLARVVVERHPEHTRSERVAGILGALRRIGQIYREMRWRYGEQRAQWHIRMTLGCIQWW